MSSVSVSVSVCVSVSVSVSVPHLAGPIQATRGELASVNLLQDSGFRFEGLEVRV